MKNEVVVAKYPKIAPKNDEYVVKFNGIEADVFQACAACFASAIFEGTVRVEITANFPVIKENVYIGPKSQKVDFMVEGNTVSFDVTNEKDLVVALKDVYQENPLFILTNAPEEKPDPEDENVIYYKGGQVYEIGKLHLKDNQTLYIEEGAWVIGVVRAIEAKNVKIAGRGVLDGSYLKREECEHSIRFDHCQDVVVKDIMLCNASVWMCVIGATKKANVDRLREVGIYCSTDGIDICGSEDVTVNNCLLMNNDDCVVIKAFGKRETLPDEEDFHWTYDVKNILVENCTFLNGPAGNGMEIGHELMTDSVDNIVFRNVDILTCHGKGAPLSIHAGDRALVSNVVFEDIRIEHCYDQLIDFRVMKSMWNDDKERGYIKNVLLKNIEVEWHECNYGYTTSMITGYDEEHCIENVTIENLTFNGKKILSGDEFDVGYRHAKNIVFK